MRNFVPDSDLQIMKSETKSAFNFQGTEVSLTDQTFSLMNNMNWLFRSTCSSDLARLRIKHVVSFHLTNSLNKTMEAMTRILLKENHIFILFHSLDTADSTSHDQYKHNLCSKIKNGLARNKGCLSLQLLFLFSSIF